MTDKEIILEQCTRLDHMATEVQAMQKLPGLALHTNHEIGVATSYIKMAAQKIRNAVGKEK